MTLNQRWAAIIIDTLISRGIRYAVVCPGSRSTPLALVIGERTELQTLVIMDERSAGFVALGLAKASRTPVMLLCTSGTAGAHFLPALAEASMAQIPLIALTADRPWELQDFGAPQTMRQVNLFSHFVTRCEALPCPEERPEMFRHLTNIVASTCASSPGPVHFNVPFREPLCPEGPSDRSTSIATSSISPRHTPDLSTLASMFQQSKRVLALCGPRSYADEFGAAIHAVLGALKVPVLAEATSQARYGFDAISMYETWLRDECPTDLRPELILRFGQGLTAKATQKFVDTCGATVVSFRESGPLCDPHHTSALAIAGDIFLALNNMSHWTPLSGVFRNQWHEWERAARQRLVHQLAFDEPGIAHTLIASLDEGATCMISSSMPIRDVDAFAPKAKGRIKVFANRAVNGIDGIVSTAVGLAKHENNRVSVLVGDVAFLHDLSAWLAAKSAGVSMNVVVINNDGGGIFHFLPVAQKSPQFESFFGTPHGANLAAAADLVGARYTLATSLPQLERALMSSDSRLHLIECQTERSSNVGRHRALFQALKGVAS
jgi:2-succinyl-5-enolpyruvyl-6-hydroxy-3-cyclohexene-1-carboxylate synthase